MKKQTILVGVLALASSPLVAAPQAQQASPPPPTSASQQEQSQGSPEKNETGRHRHRRNYRHRRNRRHRRRPAALRLGTNSARPDAARDGVAGTARQ